MLKTVGFFWVLVLSSLARANYSDFLSLCVAQVGPTNRSICDQIQNQFFQSETPHFAPLSPAMVGAPALPIDSKVQFLVFNDPNYVAGVAYCYFSFRKWIDPTQVSPNALGLGANGFAIMKENLAAYQRWLEGPEGKACKARVKSESQVEVANLEVSLRGYVALIAVNPFAIVREQGANAQAVTQEMVRTLNYGRLQAYLVACPIFARWGEKQWAGLSASENKKMREAHPQYPWSDTVAASREYVALKFEDNLKEVQPLLKACK